MRISDWSSDVCSSDLTAPAQDAAAALRDRYEWVSLDEADLVVALGGDGFMLQTLHAMLDRRQPQCPVFGLNLGTVGFLMNERSEERRVGKELVSTCRSWWCPYHSKKQN